MRARRLWVQNASVSINGELDTAIAAVEARLRELDGAREAAARELTELRAQSERAISDGAGEDEPDRATSWTPQRKVALFASLFRGREDVFPHALGETGEEQQRMGALLRERVEGRGMRQAAREVWGVLRTRRSARRLRASCSHICRAAR